MTNLKSRLRAAEGVDETVRDAVFGLRMYALNKLYDIREDEGNCLCFSGFDLPRELIAGVLRDLRSMRLVECHKGLFSPASGMPYGSGYAITREGIATLQAKQAQEDE